MRGLLLSILLICTGCTHTPKCGNPEGARIILEGDRTCRVRIRQITVGRDLKIPSSLKGSGLAAFKLEWVEPGYADGKIRLGHFVLVQEGAK